MVPGPGTAAHERLGLGLGQYRAEQILSDYRMTPATLMSRLDPTYIPSRWILYLSMKIAQCVARGGGGLLISAPPRHGKSKLATISTPLWVLECFPQHMVGVVTYGEELSTDFSREIRDYVQQNPNLLSVRLRPDVTRVANFLTTAGGGLKAVGLRGTITGRGFNVLVIDDYIKEPKEAMSASYLEGLYIWYQTVARTRLEPGAVIIILATRWVKGDLHGKLMKLQELTGRNFFEYITLPALAYGEPDPGKPYPLGYPDPIGRAPGEALFPERYTQEDMENMKAEMQARWWEAMFQQNPFGDEGSVIDISALFKYTEPEYHNFLREALASPQNFIPVRYWDMASTKDAGDYSVGARGILNLKTDDFLIDDIVRGQWSPARAEAVFKTVSEQDFRRFPRIRIGMEEEPGASGKYSVRHFQKILDEVQTTIRITADKAATKGSKMLAAGPWIGHIEKGKTGIVESHWNQEFLDELETFPEGSHDDQVDAAGGAFRLAKNLIGQSPVWGRGSEIKQLRQQFAAGGQIPGDLANRISTVWGKRSGSRSETNPEGADFSDIPGIQVIDS